MTANNNYRKSRPFPPGRHGKAVRYGGAHRVFPPGSSRDPVLNAPIPFISCWMAIQESGASLPVPAAMVFPTGMPDFDFSIRLGPGVDLPRDVPVLILNRAGIPPEPLPRDPPGLSRTESLRSPFRPCGIRHPGRGRAFPAGVVPVSSSPVSRTGVFMVTGTGYSRICLPDLSRRCW